MLCCMPVLFFAHFNKGTLFIYFQWRCISKAEKTDACWRSDTKNMTIKILCIIYVIYSVYEIVCSISKHICGWLCVRESWWELTWGSWCAILHQYNLRGAIGISVLCMFSTDALQVCLRLRANHYSFLNCMMQHCVSLNNNLMCNEPSVVLLKKLTSFY